MKNQEIAAIFYEIADFLRMDNIPFKPQAYQKAALSLEGLEADVAVMYHQGGIKALEEIPGVGLSIAEKIEEYLKTGKIKYHQQLKKRTPLNLEELIAVEGMGPRKARFLHEKLGISNVKELEKAAQSHKIAPLPGFGEKTEKNILEGIAFAKRSTGRFLLGEILPFVEKLKKELSGLSEVERVSEAGSVRRRKETIGDVDLLVVSKSPKKVMDFFVSRPNVVKIWGKGLTKSSVRTKEGFDIDLRVVPAKSYGAALQYFTGSKEHNIALRIIAIKNGLKLSEYGLFKGKVMIAGKTEKEIYETLGMDWIPPTMRTNTGEIELAQKHQLSNNQG